MVSSSGSGGSSGSGSSSLLANSGSEGNLRQAMDQRRQRRMLSNRESARRSRMRKQKHLDDLTAQVAQLRRENNQALASYRATTQQYLSVEAENAVLHTQIMELSNRLESLNEILQYMNGACSAGGGGGSGGGHGFPWEGPPPPPSPPSQAMDGFFMSAPWSLLSVNQPIMASADLFQY